MSDPTNRPLWQTMAAARHGRPISDDSMLGQTCGHLYAAELRAIADEIDNRYKVTPYMVRVGTEDVAKMLRAEADLAEAGE